MKKIVLTICLVVVCFSLMLVNVGCQEEYVATPVIERVPPVIVLTPEEIEARRVAEAERLAKEKVEREARLAREKIEREKREKEEAIRKRIETLQSYSAEIDGEQIEWIRGHNAPGFPVNGYIMINSTLRVIKLDGTKIVFVDILPGVNPIGDYDDKCCSEKEKQEKRYYHSFGSLDFKIDQVGVTIDGVTTTYLAKDTADSKTISEAQKQFEYYLSRLANIKEGSGLTSLGDIPIPAEYVKWFNERKKEGEKITSFPAYEGKVGEDNIVWIRNPNEGKNFDSVLEVTRSDEKQLRFFAEFSSLEQINDSRFLPYLKRVEVTEFGETRTYYGGIEADSDFMSLAKEQFKHYLLGLVELKKNDGLRILRGEGIDKATEKN